MPKHSTLNASPGPNLFGGCGTWATILLITALLALFMGIVDLHERAESRQRDDELRREASPAAAIHECESHLRHRYLKDIQVERTEVKETGDLRRSVILYYSYRQGESLARKDSLLWCDLEYRGWAGWRLLDSRGL